MLLLLWRSECSFMMSDIHCMAVVEETACPGVLAARGAQCLNPRKVHPTLLQWQQHGAAPHSVLLSACVRLSPVPLCQLLTVPVVLSGCGRVAPLASGPWLEASAGVSLCLLLPSLEMCCQGFGEQYLYVPP